jgi:DNA-binding MarR family transcriptional regulator
MMAYSLPMGTPEALPRVEPDKPRVALDESLVGHPILLLVMLGQYTTQEVRAALSRHGLKPRQVQILGFLAHHEQVGQRELGDTLAIDHSILVTMLNPLESEGLIERRRSCSDRRRHVVTLTPAGARRHAEALASIDRAEQELLAQLSAEDRARLSELLAVLASGLGAQNGDEDCATI